MLCDFQATGHPVRHRCQRCGFEGEFQCRPDQVRRTCDVVDLRSWTPPAGPRNPRTCEFLGAELGTEECHSCAGRVQLKQFACAHPAHPRTTFLACRGCPDYRPLRSLPATPSRLLLRFPHGFGDAVQLTIVLRHLAAEFPRWQITVASKPGTEALFRGLCHGMVPLETPSAGFDLVRTLAWHEPDDCYPDSAATKAEKCLRDVFNINPRLELCRYHVQPDLQAMRDVAAFVEELAQAGRPRDFVLLHHQGNSARRRKNIDEQVIAAACRKIQDAELTPVLLDWDQRSGVRRMRGVVNPGAEHPLWRGRGIGDAGVIVALAHQARLCLGIDSGPGHLFAASGTRSIILWTWHHPLHYFPPADHVTHLIPWRHERLLRGRRAFGLPFFQQAYYSRRYVRLEPALVRLLEEQLQLSPPGLRMDGDLWTRADCPEDLAEVARDYVQVPSPVPGRRAPRLVVDLNPGIGAWVSRMRHWSPGAQFICRAEAAEMLTCLSRNVGAFAQVLFAECGRPTEPPGAVQDALLAVMAAAAKPGGQFDLLRYREDDPVARAIAGELQNRGAVAVRASVHPVEKP